MASQKEVDRCIARMFLRMGGERIGDAVTESEGEGDAGQSAAEPNLQQQLQRALVTAAKSRVPGAPGQVGRSQLSKAVKKELQNLPDSGNWTAHASSPCLQVVQRHRRHERQI